jgi:hypothetical protein
VIFFNASHRFGQNSVQNFLVLNQVFIIKYFTMKIYVFLVYKLQYYSHNDVVRVFVYDECYSSDNMLKVGPNFF